MAVAVLGALALKADGAINHEVADAGVAGSENGEADDDTEGDQLGRDPPELAEPLRDGVAGLVLARDGRPHAEGRAESPESESRTHLDV